LSKHIFAYNELTNDEEVDELDLHDYFLNRWCAFVQYKLLKRLPSAEAYQTFEKNIYNDNFFQLIHLTVKYKGHFIDVDGIFNENEFIKKCKKHYIKMQNKKKYSKNNISKNDWFTTDVYVEKVGADQHLSRIKWIEEYESHSLMNRASEYVVDQILKDCVMESLLAL
jgi:hypothetical protein